MSKNAANLSLVWIAGLLLIPVLTPYLGSLDANGPRLLTQSIWTLAGLFMMLLPASGNHLKLKAFIQTPPGIAYGIFLAAAGFSGLQALNINEWILQVFRIISIFVATVLVYSFFNQKQERVKPILWIFVLLLLVESLAVLNHAGHFIRGEAKNMSQFGWIYVNRNILAASIFLKIPAALALGIFTKRLEKIFSYCVFSLSVLAIFFLSSRAFYLGLILVWAVYTSTMFIRQVKYKDQSFLKPWVTHTMIILLSFALFSIIQKNLYPEDRDWIASSPVSQRFEQTIQTDQNLRIDSWKRTAELIQRNPLLGVGAGNWKISILEYESPAIPDFKYIYKNHNDFLEVTAETGIPGGLAYLALMLILVLGTLKQILNRDTDRTKSGLLLFPALALVAYGVDAFFNFPMDRPVIQSIFAILLGVGIAMLYPDRQPRNIRLDRTANWILLVVIAGAVTLHSFQLKSLKIQRMVKEDIVSETYGHPADFFLEQYPAIPDINVVGTPIVIDQIRYLLHESRNEEAKRLLLSDHSSPYDVQKAYYLGLIYARLNQMDSSVHWLSQVYHQKPLFVNGIVLYTSALFDTGESQQAFEILKKAIEEHPENEALSVQNNKLKAELVKISRPLYQQAKQAYDNKEYEKAIALITKLLSYQPQYIDLYPTRAWCYFFTEAYQKALDDLNIYAKTRPLTQEHLHLRNMCMERSSQQ